MIVQTVEEAWRIAKILAPALSVISDVEEATASGAKGVYLSNIPDSNVKVIDLNARLEVVMEDGSSEMIWIADNMPKKSGSDIEIGVWTESEVLSGCTVKAVQTQYFSNVEGVFFSKDGIGQNIITVVLKEANHRFVVGSGTGEVSYIKFI